MENLWQIKNDNGPIIATAIHAGHEVSAEVARYMVITEEDRLREEDPFTGEFTTSADAAVIVNRSRFEVDLNRSREDSVYLTLEHSWGLRVWKDNPPEDIVTRSRSIYDNFYSTLDSMIYKTVKSENAFALLDYHSYNHRRGGPLQPADDAEGNPEINIGTGNIQRKWYKMLDMYLDTLSSSMLNGFPLDVRTNVKFKGGHMSRWVNDRYGDRGFAVAIEVKKIFMNEWTGERDEDVFQQIKRCLSDAANRLRSLLTEREND